MNKGVLYDLICEYGRERHREGLQHDNRAGSDRIKLQIRNVLWPERMRPPSYDEGTLEAIRQTREV